MAKLRTRELGGHKPHSGSAGTMAHRTGLYVVRPECGIASRSTDAAIASNVCAPANTASAPGNIVAPAFQPAAQACKLVP